jgi:hypothetical protein
LLDFLAAFFFFKNAGIAIVLSPYLRGAVFRGVDFFPAARFPVPYLARNSGEPNFKVVFAFVGARVVPALRVAVLVVARFFATVFFAGAAALRVGFFATFLVAAILSSSV